MTDILHIILSGDARGGGPIEAARIFCEKWMAAGHSHTLVTLDPSDAPPPSAFPGRIVHLGAPLGRSLPALYRYAPQMVPWLKAHMHEYDAVIVSGLWRYHARGAMKALAGGDVPYFVFTHGMLDPWFRKTYPVKHAIKQVSWWLAEGRLLSHARKVLFTTEEERVLAENAFWPYKVAPRVVNYGAADVGGDPAAQMAAFRAAVPGLGARRYLLFLSRIHEKKGCDLLVDAFAAIAPGAPDLDLVIAGPDQVGLAARLKRQAEALGIGDRVHFPGMLSGDIKIGAYRGAEAFTLTSHQENFGIVVAESLACGTPVLISDKVNIWREIVDDKAGLVEPDTQAGSRQLLARFQAMSPAERDTMRANARKSFETRFDVRQAADALMRMIEAEIA